MAILSSPSPKAPKTSFLKEKHFLHGFRLLPQFGPSRLAKVFKRFGSFKLAFHAGAGELKTAGLEQPIIEVFLHHREKLDLQKSIRNLEQQNIKLLTFDDKTYPKLLSAIPDSPPLLYYRGLLENPHELCVSVVGTRRITSYARAIIPDLIQPLCKDGITVVSGLAYGVDSAAHQAAIEVKERTIAVLGGGIDDDSIYPRGNLHLAQKILQAGGAIISEQPPGTQSVKQNFVTRNRIISGLSAATLIVECATKSGALITASHAKKQQRLVLAVPGPIYSPQSEGSNNLIKSGATCVTSSADIFDALSIKTPSLKLNKKLPTLSANERRLLETITNQPQQANILIRNSGLEPGIATATLTFLEMKGRIKQLGSGQYIKID